ncbi:phospholipid scramblase 1-like [Anopheles darlingi]|uniref:phospholipid scramblase 1-like n=1 Tax=Anopheles darlingi TaxID=43151 RepID=UPI002100047E|nr:phospholipid scramblase 1-like [Anopheles darlingi]
MSMAAPIVIQPSVTSQPDVTMLAKQQCGVPMPPKGIPDYPPGLEHLIGIDKLRVCQSVDMLKMFTTFEHANKYTIKTGSGDHVYSATEDTGYCTRFCCGTLRSFDVEIVDRSEKRAVLYISRPWRCQSCWFPCCMQKLAVTASTGNVGYVVQDWSFWTSDISIKNQNDETVLKIVGPWLTFATCCSDSVFKILATDGTQIGQINKKWSGLCKELFTDADNFNITFPIDLDVRVKATLLAALLLIDYMYFEGVPVNLIGSLVTQLGL